MKLSEIREILSATELVGAQKDRVVLAAGGGELVEDFMKAVISQALLLTGRTDDEIMTMAILCQAGGIVYVRDKQPNQHTLDLARSNNIAVLKTKHSMFVACGRLYLHGLREIEGAW